MNRALVLGILARCAGLSRADLARATGLSKTTVSSIVDELIADGFVTTVGRGKVVRGRRPDVLRFSPHARYVIGVELSNTLSRAFLTDLEAQPLREHTLERGTTGPEDAVAMAADAIEAVSSGLVEGTILGIGVGTPGLVEPRTGVIMAAADLGWRRVPVGQMLSERVGLPVLVSNRATTAALGEYWRGAGRGAQVMIYVSVSTGIAAGLVFGGVLYRGVSMSEGQLGHVAVEPDGPACTCGSRGCLQLYAAGPALLGTARTQARLAPDSVLHVLCEGDLNALTLEAVGQAAAADDKAAAAAVAQTGRYLGIGVADLVSLLNPDVVVLGGAVIQAVPQIITRARHEVDLRASPLPAAAVRLVPADLGPRAVGVGAAALLLTDWRRAELGPLPNPA